MSAWLFQAHRKKKELGESAPWSVGWYDPDGKKRSKQIGSRSRAEKFRQRLAGQLAAGTYNKHEGITWKEFRAKHDSRVLPLMEASTRIEVTRSLNHFKRLAKPARLCGVTTQLIDEFIAKRRAEDSPRGGSVSPATVNKDLRHIKAALAIAIDWGYLQRMPKVRMLREPKKLPRYIDSGDFRLIYQFCSVATLPRTPSRFPFEPADWWRAVLIFARMTGWRISEILALRRGDLDLEAGQAITRHTDNKGKRDEAVPLHPVVIEHLQRINSFEPVVFPWYHNRSTLRKEFHRIQKAAGLAEPFYGFHDIRRAFATMNADRLSSNELQAMMRHRSPSTTQGYINLARMLTRTADRLDVPDLAEKKALHS